MKFATTHLDEHYRAVDDQDPNPSPVKILQISGPCDGYQGSTFVTRIDWPVDPDVGIFGWLLFPESRRFFYEGSLDSFKTMIRKAPTATALLRALCENKKFEVISP